MVLSRQGERRVLFLWQCRPGVYGHTSSRGRERICCASANQIRMVGEGASREWPRGLAEASRKYSWNGAALRGWASGLSGGESRIVAKKLQTSDYRLGN